MVSVILLASGRSIRFGQNKLLWNYENQPLFLYTVQAVLACKSQYFEEYRIVTCYPEIAEHILVKENFQVIWNENPEQGISHSLILGLRGANPKGDYLFCVCDQPALTKDTINGLAESFYHSEKSIACLSYKERRGNPVIFSNCYRKELLELKGDMGGKQIIKCHKEELLLYEVSNQRELLDIDYPQGKGSLIERSF